MRWQFPKKLNPPVSAVTVPEPLDTVSAILNPWATTRVRGRAGHYGSCSPDERLGLQGEPSGIGAVVGKLVLSLGCRGALGLGT